MTKGEPFLLRKKDEFVGEVTTPNSLMACLEV